MILPLSASHLAAELCCAEADIANIGEGERLEIILAAALSIEWLRIDLHNTLLAGPGSAVVFLSRLVSGCILFWWGHEFRADRVGHRLRQDLVNGALCFVIEHPAEDVV